MHTNDALSNLSYKALGNDKVEAGSFNAAVRQNLTKSSYRQDCKEWSIAWFT